MQVYTLQGVGDDSCFVIILLLVHIHLPSFLLFLFFIFSFYLTLLPLPTIFFVSFFSFSPGVCEVLQDDPASVTEDISFLFHIFTFSEEYRLAHHLYTVFSILGHGGFRQVTLMAVNGICSAKVLCKPSLFKRVNFFRSTDRPG